MRLASFWNASVNTEGADDLEDAYNLVLQWWEQVPGESGIDPYPD
jgi:hypothetical protein